LSVALLVIVPVLLAIESDWTAAVIADLLSVFS
jgi:hypothetical protein